MIDLAIIIVHFKTLKLTQKCLESIYKSTPKAKFEIFLVDNNSADGSLQLLKKDFPKVNFIESNENLGFAGGNNLALKSIRAQYYLLLNSDTEMRSNAIDKLFEFAKTSDFGIISCKLLNPDGSFQPNGGKLPTFMPLLLWLSGFDDILRKFMNIQSYQSRDEKYYSNNKEIGWVSGSVMLIKNEVVEKIGYLDDKIFMYGEDVEYCLRANKAGYKIGWTNQASILHIGGASSKTPKYNQWMGEFRGLIYIYQKFFGLCMTTLLRVLCYIFIFARIIGFLFFGKISYSRTYAKIFINL